MNLGWQDAAKPFGVNFVDKPCASYIEDCALNKEACVYVMGGSCKVGG